MSVDTARQERGRGTKGTEAETKMNKIICIMHFIDFVSKTVTIPYSSFHI